jgi:hypothetical protein
MSFSLSFDLYQLRTLGFPMANLLHSPSSQIAHDRVPDCVHWVAQRSKDLILAAPSYSLRTTHQQLRP